jgi:hypothetical protein
MEERFLKTDLLVPEFPQSVAMFSREELEHGLFRTYYSVSQSCDGLAKSRAIVIHEGDDTGAGAWKCSKDSANVACPHIQLVESYMKRLWPNATRTVDPEQESHIGLVGALWD